MTDPVWEIRRDDALGPDALALIAQSEEELASLYAPEHRYAFSPEQLLNADVRFIVGYLDSDPVACGGVAPCDGYGELKRIFTTRSARGKRLAVKIVEALEEEARAFGAPIMRLETGLASPDALALYRRMNYREVGPFGSYVDNGSSVFMEKDL
ncbi:MAG: GNAT family N-acetyltransferase [Pseudomonadota bacterium]